MIPERYKNVKFEEIDQQIKDLYPVLKKERKGIYIHGGVGTGKTFAAYGIFQQWELDKANDEKIRQEIVEKYTPQNGMRTDKDGKSFYFEDVEMIEKQKQELAKHKSSRPSMRFENVPQMLYFAKRDYKDNTDYQDEILNSKRVFILDDIGVEKVSEFVEEFMYMLINKQYEKVYPIVITSNLPLSQLAEKLGDRIVSRIKEMCYIVELKGEDKRLGK
jgi:DNA replication protein DnaC